MKLSSVHHVAGITLSLTVIANASSVEMVKDLTPGHLKSSFPKNLIACGGYLYFETYDRDWGTTYYPTISYYKYDGVTDEITKAANFPEDAHRFICFKDELYCFDGVPQETTCSYGWCTTESLWGIYRYDGSTKTVVYDAKIDSLNGRVNFFEYQSELYFGLEGPKLMKTDGVDTEVVCDLQPGWNPVDDSEPTNMGEHNGSLYFMTKFMTKDDDDNNVLYKYNEEEGRSLFYNFGTNEAYHIFSFKGNMYLIIHWRKGGSFWYSSYGYDVKKLGGGNGDTIQGETLSDETTIISLNNAFHAIEFGDSWYFKIRDERVVGTTWYGSDETQDYYGMWKYDGEDVQQIINNVFGGPMKDSVVHFENLFKFEDKLFFAASDGTIPDKSVLQLWKWPGTDNATVVQSTFPFDPKEFTKYQGRLYFAASGDGTGEELWVYTPDGWEKPAVQESTPTLQIVDDNGTVDINKASEDGADAPLPENDQDLMDLLDNLPEDDKDVYDDLINDLLENIDDLPDSMHDFIDKHIDPRAFDSPASVEHLNLPLAVVTVVWFILASL